MKKSYITSIILLALAASASSMAATGASGPQKVIGHVSITGAGTVDQAEIMLNEKARSAGGDGIHITGMGGKNKLFATAEVLKN